MLYHSDYYTFSDAHNALALMALRRTASSPVSLEQVKTMFVELLSHDESCGCGQCEWVQEAKPDRVVRAETIGSVTRNIVAVRFSGKSHRALHRPHRLKGVKGGSTGGKGCGSLTNVPKVTATPPATFVTTVSGAPFLGGFEPSTGLQVTRIVGKESPRPVIPATSSVPAVLVVHVLRPSAIDNLRRVTPSVVKRSSSARTSTPFRCSRSLSRSQSAATAAYWNTTPTSTGRPGTVNIRI